MISANIHAETTAAALHGNPLSGVASALGLRIFHAEHFAGPADPSLSA
jgi:hypothetical protein